MFPGADAGPVRFRGRWARRSWGGNDPLTVRAQVFHGMEEAGYGYWGFSPANKPEGDYGVWGIDGGGWTRTACHRTRTRRSSTTASPAARMARRTPTRRQSAYTNGVVTPHAAFLALRYAPRCDPGEPAEARGGLPGPLREVGLSRSVNVQTKRVSDAYLWLDQGMIMAALESTRGRLLRRAFADRGLERRLRPVIGIERFNTAR